MAPPGPADAVYVSKSAAPGCFCGSSVGLEAGLQAAPSPASTASREHSTSEHLQEPLPVADAPSGAANERLTELSRASPSAATTAATSIEGGSAPSSSPGSSPGSSPERNPSVFVGRALIWPVPGRCAPVVVGRPAEGDESLADLAPTWPGAEADDASAQDEEWAAPHYAMLIAGFVFPLLWVASWLVSLWAPPHHEKVRAAGATACFLCFILLASVAAVVFFYALTLLAASGV